MPSKTATDLQTIKARRPGERNCRFIKAPSTCEASVGCEEYARYKVARADFFGLCVAPNQ